MVEEGSSAAQEQANPLLERPIEAARRETAFQAEESAQSCEASRPPSEDRALGNSEAATASGSTGGSGAVAGEAQLSAEIGAQAAESSGSAAEGAQQAQQSGAPSVEMSAARHAAQQAAIEAEAIEASAAPIDEAWPFEGAMPGNLRFISGENGGRWISVGRKV